MASTSFHGIRGASLTGEFREGGASRWLRIAACTEGNDSAEAIWHTAHPGDVLRLASDLLTSAINAEDIPNLIWEPHQLADWGIRDRGDLHNELNKWALGQCTAEGAGGEHKLTALAWLALDEQRRCDACDRWWPEGY